jgi:hypothetical protein
MNTIFIATARDFAMGSPDKNGNSPIILNVIAGKAPNRTVLAGTIAETEGFEVGNAYMVKCAEQESNEYGRQFRFTKISQVDALEVLNAAEKLGEAQIINVEGETTVGEAVEVAETVGVDD